MSRDAQLYDSRLAQLRDGFDHLGGLISTTQENSDKLSPDAEFTEFTSEACYYSLSCITNTIQLPSNLQKHAKTSACF